MIDNRFEGGNFTLAELTHTNAGLDNTPDETVLNNLLKLKIKLEEVRALLRNKPMKINSAYRSPAVNAAVGGSAASAHMVGLAADFVCTEFGSPLQICNIIANSGIEFDQLIHEHGRWVHIAFSSKPRQQLLTNDRTGTRLGLFEARN